MTESPLKLIKNGFTSMLKALFVREILTFLYWVLCYVEERLDKKTKVNFKIYDFIDWTKINCNTHIVQYLNK